MFAQVVVKTKIPSIGKSYTYKIPEELEKNAQPGKLVEVPFGRKNEEGIILSLSEKKPDFAVKEIKVITPSENELDENALDLAFWMSVRYNSNFFECIKAMLPKDSAKGSNLKRKEGIPVENELPLTPAQSDVFKEIKKAIETGKDNRILIHGVTGSGKTELYMQAASIIISKGKQVLFMVPEISLTPQLIQRFSERFGIDNIAVVHSQITSAMKGTTWKEIRSGEKTIVIGSRSAILSPFKDLGAVIVDECHEQSYKQDKNPKYNAIEIAKYLNSRDGTLLLLGSATPLVEQYFESINGNLNLLSLMERISGKFPNNIVVDMRKEKENNNYSSISKILQEHIKKSMTKDEQILLYFNRRGVRSSLICTKCGSHENCPRCEMPLTIHAKKQGTILVCHYCFFTKPMITKCSTCGSRFIKGLGNGTQSILEEIKKLEPTSNPIIMDRDTTTKKGSHEKIFNQFKNKESDILIGTQMITKGWDISNVSLTGYIMLDTDLVFPSFRTSERAYQLITQFSGRSGRGDKTGTSIIQTYNPENQVLKDALTNNYKDFYNKEIILREKLGYPPYTDLIQVITKSKDEKKGLDELKKYIRTLGKALDEVISTSEYDLLGPSRCFISKINNEYFFQVTYKIKKSKKNTLVFDSPVYQTIENNNLACFVYVINKTQKPAGLSINIEPFELL